MENQKYFGKVREMYISAIFHNTGKVSLSADVNEAINLDKNQQLWAMKKLGAQIIRVRTFYEEVNYNEI